MPVLRNRLVGGRAFLQSSRPVSQMYDPILLRAFGRPDWEEGIHQREGNLPR
jgi:hypothetical protein